jgi:hypothetical protein
VAAGLVAGRLRWRDRTCGGAARSRHSSVDLACCVVQGGELLMERYVPSDLLFLGAGALWTR